jgi:hypothetical protein
MGTRLRIRIPRVEYRLGFGNEYEQRLKNFFYQKTKKASILIFVNSKNLCILYICV